MSYEVVSYPLALGVQQGVDRTMLPPGTLIAATGVRRRKGGIAKANGLTNAGVTAHAGVFAGPCDALGYAAGRQVAVMAGQAWARRATGDTWVEVGRASRSRPVKAHWESFTDASAGILQAAVATISPYRAQAYYDGVGVHVTVTDQAGLRRAAGFFTNRDHPRIFVVGTTFVVVTRGGTSVYAATVNSATLAISAETAIATLTTANDTFDAAPYSATEWLLALRNGTTAFEVGLWNLSLASTGAFQQVACSNSTITACSVYGIDGEGIWCTFDDSSNQKVAAFAEDLSSVTGGPTAFENSANPSWPAVMTRRASGSVWMVYTDVTTSPLHYTMRLRSVDTAAASLDAGVAHHVRPASRPWGGTTSRLSIWVHTDNGPGNIAGAQNGWATQRRYSLVTLSVDSDVPLAFGMLIEPELSPDERSNSEIGFHLPEVAFLSVTDGNGSSVERGFFPGLSTIRTQSDSVAAGTAALVVYEWETDTGFDARARQVAEVGGQGVVFGGGLQELPSSRINSAGIDTLARGLENGYLYAPTILSVAAKAGGSLTSGELYQLVAVFEQVTPDGLRTRSAPSNIVSLTPSGGNLTIEIKITTAATSEREFASPPNQSVVHVYATVGNGNTFQRVTADSGLSAAIGLTGTSLITFNLSAADTTYEDNEALYTEVGSPPQLANYPAPAHRFGWVGGGYAWVGGLFNPQLGERSKLTVPNEPVQFTRDNTHRFLIPEGMTGGAWMDGVSVVFSLDSIFLVSEALGTPQRHPSPVGCIDFRSIVETRDGIVFQSRRGIELLPRGFGQVVLLSSPVEDSLRGRLVTSATVTGHAGSAFAQAERVGESLLVLSAIDTALDTDFGVRLVYDLDAGRWLSVDPALSASGVIGEVLSNWNGRLVVASRTGTTIRYESPADWGATEAVPVSITLADLRPFDILRRGQTSRVLVLGEVRSTTEITLSAYVDGLYSKALSFQQPTQLVTGTKGDKFILVWQLPTRQINALTLRLSCADPSGLTPGEGVVLHAVGIEAEGLPGRPRIGQERQAA